MARFAEISTDELDALIEKKDARNTQKQIDVAFNVLTSYCKEKGITFCPEQITKYEMNNILVMFYVEARKLDGTMYKKNSFFSLRFGVQRKMQKYQDNFDIINDCEFQKSNEIFNSYA